MAPIPTTSNLAVELQTSHANTPRTPTMTSLPPQLLSRISNILSKRNLGPSQKQSVGMAVGLSIAGIIVAIFVFGWLRYIIAREHQREADRVKAKEGITDEGAEPPAEDPPAE